MHKRTQKFNTLSTDQYRQPILISAAGAERPSADYQRWANNAEPIVNNSFLVQMRIEHHIHMVSADKRTVRSVSAFEAQWAKRG